jgi:class 3 adenylate cyclase
MNLEELGNTIKSYRTRLGFTQNDLASALQVSPQAVSKWERGENAPDIAALPALSEVLGVSIDTLLGSSYREKRTIESTVVYADMEGFGPLARSLSPADLAIALNAFFYPLTEHLIAYDGVPIKYIGDELLCVFAGDGHRLRAFRAVFAAKAASPRPLRITVSSGPVWMGGIGHPLYARPDVLGEAVNLAAVLQDWAKAKAEGGVAASEAAVGPVRSSLSLGRSEEISSWGSVGPARVHEVKGLA